jgi:hypothetical protein
VFNSALGKIAKSATAGLFMSQLLYWWGKGSNEKWIYKTIREMQEETCLTRSEQDRAIKIWKKLEILKVERGGMPRKRYFQINIDGLTDLLGIE